MLNSSKKTQKFNTETKKWLAETKKGRESLGKAAGACAAAGAGTYMVTDGAGLAIGGGAVGLGLLAFTGVGAVVGLAGYAVYKGLQKK